MRLKLRKFDFVVGNLEEMFQGETLLHAIVEKGNKVYFDQFLKKRKTFSLDFLTKPNMKEKTAFYLACEKGFNILSWISLI